MADAGHSYADIDAAEDEFRTRFEAITSAPGAFEEDDDEAISVSPDGEIDEAVSFDQFGPQALSPEAQAKADLLADEERTVALAAWECNEPIRELEESVQFEYEQKFVDQYGSAIQEAMAE